MQSLASQRYVPFYTFPFRFLFVLRIVEINFGVILAELFNFNYF